MSNLSSPASDVATCQSILRPELFAGKACVITGGGSGIDLKLPHRREHWEVVVHGATAPFNGDAADAGGHGYPQGAAS